MTATDATDGEITARISKELDKIEAKEHVKILRAVESGSRAWDFASPDSDYDVRFFYVRDRDFYLRLGETRDVIEWMLNETLDINGWDIRKSLRLLHKSNPTLFEWASSPIVYRSGKEWGRVSAVFGDYFLSKPCLHHYLSMAEGNYRAYLKSDLVKAKKYLYVLRPVLACKWILQRRSPPPMRFSDLMAAELEAEIVPAVEELLRIKAETPEAGLLPRIQVLNDYIESALSAVKRQTEELPSEQIRGFEELDRLFLSLLL